MTANDFRINYTKSFTKNLFKLVKGDPPLNKKFLKAIGKLKRDPYQGQRLEDVSLGERRIWVGDNYRLFYDIEGGDIVLLYLKKKDKKTYR
ncbi:type II toxin-antitoxin system RelE/ParE family toxin [Candidatus Daviesbacteria bacterium]|nr:type II toxin-antitoxin system RelE/ParE family toxin [Candidatus Daviesbacteria bacterium]